jgi:hypothetical protein
VLSLLENSTRGAYLGIALKHEIQDTLWRLF